MNNIKRIIFLLALVLPVVCFAQGNVAEALLDKAVSIIKASKGVQMNFTMSMYDGDDEELFTEKGVLKMEGGKFALLAEQMKLWCDGETQWSYLPQNNEIYISEPNADDARAFSPVHLMQLYKSGYRCVVDKALATAKDDAVVMTPVARGDDIKKVIVLLDKKSCMPAHLTVCYDNGSMARIKVDSYKNDCKFSSKEFRCREKNFPGAEVVDMR